MAKKRRILLVALLVVVVGGIIWLCLQFAEPPEPVYKGKPLSYWFEGYTYKRNRQQPPTHDQADEAIRQMGTNALPILLRMLQLPNLTLKERFLAMAQGQHFIKISCAPSDRHSKCLGGFRALGPGASNAVPRLIVIFDKNLASFPQQAIPVILAGIGPAARDAIPTMLRGLTHTNEIVRYNSIRALVEIHEEPKTVVPALIKCLKDPNAYIRAHAADGLGSFGKDAQSAVPMLVELCSKETPSPASGAGLKFYSTVMYQWGTLQAATGPLGMAPADVFGCATNALKEINPERFGTPTIIRPPRKTPTF